jgi:hypothetical protein
MSRTNQFKSAVSLVLVPLLAAPSGCSVSLPLFVEAAPISAQNSVTQSAKQSSVTAEDDIWSIEVDSETDTGASATLGSRSEEKADISTARASLSAAPDAALKSPGQTQPIYWQLPQSRVSHFVIRYGATASALSEELTVKTEDLDVVEDSVQGKLFRFYLPLHSASLSGAASVFYTVQAFNNSEASGVSPLARVIPSKNSS